MSIKGLLGTLKKNRSLYCKRCLHIRDKASELVPFILNPSQRKLFKIVEEWEEKYPSKRTRPTLYIVILKARQIGFSTAVEALFFHALLFAFNKIAMVVSYDEDSAKTINDMSQRFYNYLPQAVKPVSRPYRGKGILLENPKFNPNLPISDTNDPGLQSKFLIETARNANAGSAYTINYLHLSEVSKWPGNPKETMTSILQTVPKNNSIVIIESTAKGFNYFKHIWDSAVSGKSGYVPLFVPWHEHGEYRMPNEGQLLTSEEKKLKELYNLDNDQIAWRRWCIEKQCSGDEEMFKQEYPSCPEEAFLFTGTPVFNNDAVMKRIDEIRDIKYPIGDLTYEYENEQVVDSSIKFTENEHGFLTIFEEPVEGRPYVIGGDIAEGGVNYSSAHVLDNITGKQVAVWHGHCDTDVYAKQMYCLGKYYNYAVIAVEMNFDTHPVKELQRLGYKRQYMRETIDSITKTRKRKFGWRTDSLSRPLMISNLVTVVRDAINSIYDIKTLREMLNFIRNEDGRPEAIYGENDDLVIGLAITHQARGQQVFRTIEGQKKLTEIQEHKYRLARNKDVLQKRLRIGGI